MKTLYLLLCKLAILSIRVFIILITTLSVSVAQKDILENAKSFSNETGAKTTIDKATNSISYIRFPENSPYSIKGSSFSEKSANFLQEQSSLFPLRDGLDGVKIKNQNIDDNGLESVTMQQTYMGVPVFSGETKYHYNQKGQLLAINGNFISDIKVNPTPSISAEQAGKMAIKLLSSGNFMEQAHPIQVKKSTLYIFQKGLIQGYNGSKYLVYEVEIANDWDIREFLYIDAHDGTLVEQFTGMHGIDRRIYESSTSSNNLKWAEGNTFPGDLDDAKKNEIETTGQVYNFFKNVFGYTSFNNKDAIMVVVDKNSSLACPNASWNGISTNFCEGTAADDAIAHEWAHAYTEYTSGLIYAYQSGALNEAYSDIWGETIDILNGTMDENENNDIRTGCGSSQRWIIGEKVTSMGGGTGLRDMWDPTCKGLPGKITDSEFYCGTGDNGGVHRNSGVLNHAYALLVDGGTYNGQTINGIGLTKAAHIFWRAQTAYMTPTTDYIAQADILESALADLIGMELKGLSTANVIPGNSGEIITKADALELKKVLMAVEMRTETNCTGSVAMLKPVSELCVGGSSENAIFFENFESGLGNWTVSNSTPSSSWINRNWEVRDFGPGGRNSKVAYGTDNTGGNCNSSSQNGVIMLKSPAISIPNHTFGPYMLAFDHYVSIESGYDGGNVMYKIDNGAWTLIPASAFTDNPYNRAYLISAAAGNSNPLAGQGAFSGTDSGTLSGSWGQSRINLTSLGLTAGQSIQLQWQVGTDGCSGYDGWYIDDVRVYTCSTPSLQFETSGLVINEGESSGCNSYTEKTFKFKINNQPSQPVNVTLTQNGGNATSGEKGDYIISPTQFELNGEHLEEIITVRIFNDGIVESEEQIVLGYSFTNNSGGNAYAASELQTMIIKLTDDDFTTESTAHALLTSNFSNGLPIGWKSTTQVQTNGSWTINDNSSLELSPNNKQFMIVNSDQTALGYTPMDVSLESSPFNGLYMSAINLSFKEFFKPYIGTNDFDEVATVEVWDGQNWQILLTQNEATGTSGSWSAPKVRNISIPVQYANTQMKIRFRYQANFDYWWAVDDISINGQSVVGIQEEKSKTSSKQNLGPNQTVYFRDPESGNIITKITNLSDHDYGCTSVTVDRSGSDATSWVNNNMISQKTIRVSPANNNLNGKYEISLYFTDADLGNFKGSKIKAIGKSQDGIPNSNQSNTSWAPLSQTATISSGWVYTAIFDTGFSGFGLSDATSAVPLPVVLTSFTGENTQEGNQLKWGTTFEANHHFFTIERSIDGKSFESLANVNEAIAATDKGVKSYEYLDQTPKMGTNYYRLKQIDLDGTFAYSRMISIKSESDDKLVAFPNPTTDNITFSLQEGLKSNFNVSIFNMNGQVVQTETNRGQYIDAFTTEVRSLPVGKYLIQISNGVLSQTATFVKR